MVIVVFQSITDNYYRHTGTRLRTFSLHTNRYHSDTIVRRCSYFDLHGAEKCLSVGWLYAWLLQFIYVFLIRLINDVVYYFYLFIILFRNLYSEFHVIFHARSHFFPCVSLSTCTFTYFSWSLFDFSSISLTITTW